VCVCVCVYTVANFSSVCLVLHRCGQQASSHIPATGFKALEKKSVLQTIDTKRVQCLNTEGIRVAEWRGPARTEGCYTYRARNPRCRVYPVPQGAGGAIQNTPPSPPPPAFLRQSINETWCMKISSSFCDRCIKYTWCCGTGKRAVTSASYPVSILRVPIVRVSVAS